MGDFCFGALCARGGDLLCDFFNLAASYVVWHDFLAHLQSLSFLLGLRLHVLRFFIESHAFPGLRLPTRSGDLPGVFFNLSASDVVWHDFFAHLQSLSVLLGLRLHVLRFFIKPHAFPGLRLPFEETFMTAKKRLIRFTLKLQKKIN